MSVRDPDCGTCRTLKMPSGKTHVIDHQFPKALKHYYPLPALEATSIPVYRGNFDHDGTRYRGVITIELDPSPNLVAHGLRESTLPDGLDDLLYPMAADKGLPWEVIKLRGTRLDEAASLCGALEYFGLPDPWPPGEPWPDE